MNYTFRNPDIVLPDSDRFKAFDICRADPANPVVTAQNNDFDGGMPIYLQFLYEDPPGLDMPNDGHRRDYWREWINEFCLYATGKPPFIAIEHPYSMGARRLEPVWLEFFETMAATLTIRFGCPVYQFGVSRLSPNVYQFPLSPAFCNTEAEHALGIWLNLPGAPAFSPGRYTTRAEFLTGLSWAKATGIQDVILWSNPAVPTASSDLKFVHSAIDLLDPEPTPFRPFVTRQPDESWANFLSRLAAAGDTP